MTQTDRLYRWNRWYDGLPEMWRFQVIVWALLLVGAVNMALTVWTGFPFALLLVLAIAFIAFVRVPHVLGWVQAPDDASAAEGAPARVRIEGLDWVRDANRWYDAQPEAKRYAVVLGILVAAGALNMLLTIGSGFSFGLLFLIAFLCLIAVRVPYTAGWLGDAGAPAAAARPAPPVMLAPREESAGAVSPPAAALTDEAAPVPAAPPRPAAPPPPAA